MINMANKNNSTTNNQLLLINEHLFLSVYTAGTNVKKFTQQADKNNQTFNILEVCKFGLRLVESRTLPLEVCAKIVCGMGQIRLYHLQKLFAEVTFLVKKYTLNRAIEYGQKDVVMKMQVDCKTKGKRSGTNIAISPDSDLGVDLDINEETEKEIIFSLVSSKNTTTVKNVQDITLRDDPRVGNYSVLEYDQDEDDFGPLASNEMLDFCSVEDELQRNNDRVDSALVNGKLAILQNEMDIDQLVKPDLDVPNDTDSTTSARELVPLQGTLEPVPIPMELSILEKDTQMIIPALTNDESCEGSIPDFSNDDATSKLSLLPKETIVQQETEIVKNPGDALRKRCLVINARTQISYNCMEQRILNWPISLANLQRPNPKEELNALLAKVRLQNLFTKPMRPWLFSSAFELPKSVKRKASFAEYDLCRTKRHNAKRSTTNEVPTQTVIEKSPIGGVNDPPIHSPTDQSQSITTVEHVQESEIKSFLTSFTGNPSEWNFLKSCDPSSNEPQKQKKNDQGVVTRYAAVKVLESMFENEPDNSVQFELLQKKMSNRLIAASLFGKLLDLSKDKTIIVSTDERGIPVRVQKYMNWKGA